MTGNKRLILITSREPYNTEGNSHMHYLDALSKDHEIIFVNPPESWPQFKRRKKTIGNISIISYLNVFPLKFFAKFFSRINDRITARALTKEVQGREFILWQFDPYYLEDLGKLKPQKIIYFPLDYYGTDPRDSKFAKRADLLVTVNSLFIRRGYDQLNSNLLLLPHGFSEKQLLAPSEEKKMKEVVSSYEQYIIFTGAITQWLHYPLLTDLAKKIAPIKVLVLGKEIYNGEEKEEFKKQDNVVFLGHIHFEKLKLYIANATAAIVAYQFEEESSRNPIKITDYLSQNKLIISTSMSKDLQPLEAKALYTASDKDEFIELTQKAIAGELLFDEEFIKDWREKNSYANLLNRIWKALEP